MAKEPEAGSPSWNSVTFQGNRVFILSTLFLRKVRKEASKEKNCTSLSYQPKQIHTMTPFFVKTVSIVWFSQQKNTYFNDPPAYPAQRFRNAKGLPNTSLFSASASCGSSATLPAPEEGPQLKVKSPDPVGEGQRLVALQHLKRSDFANEKKT